MQNTVASETALRQFSSALSLSIGQLATTACMLEVTAPKAGNVYPGKNFADLSVEDFIRAAFAIGQEIDAKPCDRLGDLVLRLVKASQSTTRSNANLGIVLLLAPLVMAAKFESLDTGVCSVLASLTPIDCELVYQAIRLANPGGLGECKSSDVRQKAPQCLIEAMRLAADRDSIARCYVNDFAMIFELIVPLLNRHFAEHGSWHEAIRWAQVSILKCCADSLIGRKCGPAEAAIVSEVASNILEQKIDQRRTAWDAFDDYLRSDGNRLNPGTTADLIAAGLFCIFWKTQPSGFGKS